MTFYKHKWMPNALDVINGTVVLYEFNAEKQQRLWSITGKSITGVLAPADLKFEDFVKTPKPVVQKEEIDLDR